MKTTELTILGPTAIGKTTFSKTLCTYLKKNNKKCHYIFSPPFGGLSFLLLKLVVSLLKLAHNKNLKVLKLKEPVAFLEIAYSGFFSTILPLIIALDAVSQSAKSIILRLFAAFFRTIIVIEDGLPQAIGDHIIYSLLYSRESKIIKLAVKAEYALLSKKRGICIKIAKVEEKRLVQGARRGSTIDQLLGLYNRIIRGKVSFEVCNKAGLKSIRVLT